MTEFSELQKQIEQYPEEHQDRLLAAMTREAKRIFAEDPDVSPNGSLPSLLDSSVPALPRAARPSDDALAQAEDVARWLTVYTDYASKRSPMTPRTFHEAAGLWLGSVAIARRLYCPMPFDKVWPNLFVLWVADTTLFRKTTAYKPVEELAHDALNHLLLPQEFTPEALLSELAGKDPPGLDESAQDLRDLWQARRNFAAQRGLILDEFSGIMASARKDYNAGLTETFLRLYDCPLSWEKRTQTHGLIRVRSPYISLLSATTPAALAPYLSKEAWLSGFWPRFALLSPESDHPDWVVTRERPERPPWLAEHLSWLANSALPAATYPTPPKPAPVSLADDAYRAWERYSKAVSYDLLTAELSKNLWGLYGRLPTQGLKVATILAALDWDGDEQPTIEAGHWARAQQIVESWRESVHRLLVPVRVQEEQRQEEKIIAIVDRSGDEGYTARETAQLANQSRGEVEPVLDRLIRDGILNSYVPDGARVKRFRTNRSNRSSVVA